MTTCIDVHSHFLPVSIFELLRRDGVRYATPVQTRDDGKIFVLTPERPYGPIGPGFYDIAVRKKYLADHNIAIQVLAPVPFLFSIGLELGALLLYGIWYTIRRALARSTNTRRSNVDYQREGAQTCQAPRFLLAFTLSWPHPLRADRRAVEVMRARNLIARRLS